MNRGERVRMVGQVASQNLELLPHAARAQRLTAVTAEDQSACVRQPEAHRRLEATQAAGLPRPVRPCYVDAVSRAPAPSSPAPRPADEEVIAGSVERLTFHNPENGFSVLRVQARGRRGLITVVGHAAAISPGEWINASGSWIHDRTYGPQFRARFLQASEPTSNDGIRRYLASGLIHGIGPVYAKKLVDAFGAAIFDVIDNEPDRLREVDGIGAIRAARICDAWADQKSVREIMVFLHEHGVGTARAVRIYKTYGADAVRVMSENPYQLARDIRGIGFRTADALAMRLGIEKTAMIRIRAGVGFALLEAMSDGHCGLPAEELLAKASELLEAPTELIEPAIEHELADRTIVADTVRGTDCLFLATLHRAEQAIARRVRAIAAGPLPWREIDPSAALRQVEARTGLKLARLQAEAIRRALASKMLVMTGGPGVGKTTVVNALLAILAPRGVGTTLCAPTGRAARRLSETTGLPAKTIHRLLEVDPATGRFQRDEERPISTDLIVVDEASMVDVPLMHALLRAVPDGAAVLIVGDIDQLPSVGPGQVLSDLIASGAVPVVRLTEVFRQAAGSRIITNAHRVNAGELPRLGKPEGETDFYFVPADDADASAARVRELVTVRIPRRFGLDPIDDIQVLCPMNRGGAGARALNLELQAALNPAGGRPAVERFGWTLAAGDKVMQTENDYDRDVYNGDIGRVEAVDPELGELRVRFDGRPVTYGFGELDALVPAYATTIHKSQGSEYPAVVIPIVMQHYIMLQRNLLYTGITRGRRLVVLVGQPKAVAVAVRTVSGRRRWSRLAEWLLPARESR